MATDEHRPLTIGIGGCSCSGKTTLAHELARQLDGTLFPLDLYYRDLSEFPLDARSKKNFDHPDSLESELMVEHVRALARGGAIERPVYDFKRHTRVAGAFETVSPKGVVIVEGILALHYAELVACYGFSIYIHAPQEVCLSRRIERDMRARGRTEAAVREQWQATTWPMAEMYVVPSAMRATIMVEGTGAVDWPVRQVLNRLSKDGLIPG